MSEEKGAEKPERFEYKGRPVLRIPLVDQSDPKVHWHYVSFGKNKAWAFLRYISEIETFANE